MQLSRYYHIALRYFALGVLLLGVVGKGYGQDKKRKYATREHDFSSSLLGLGGRVINPSKAVDGIGSNYSTLELLVGALGVTYAEQVVDFNPDPEALNANNSPIFPPGTPISIKLSIPASILGIGTGIIIQPIQNLRREGVIIQNWSYDPVGTEITGGNLLALLSGAGESELTIIPEVPFQGIRIRLSSTVGIDASVKFFHAYVLENGIVNCDERDKAIDILSGVRAGAAAILNATGIVTDPWNAIDGDLNTSALINIGAQVLSEVYHTTIFQTPSRPNQVARIVLERPGGGLLDLNLLSGLKIQPHLGTSPVGEPINESTLLSVRLLPGSTGKNEITVPVSGSFDRIEVKLGGILGALETLIVYEVSRLPEFPNLDESIAGGEVDICENGTIVLEASAPVPNGMIRWYAEADGGLPLAVASSFTTPYLGETTTYYVSFSPEGCSVESARVPVDVIVHPKPSTPEIAVK